MSAVENPPAQWAVVDNGWRFIVAELVKVTAAQARYKEGQRECRVSISAIMAIGDEVTVRKVADRLTSAKAECYRREQAARVWFEQEKARIRDAARSTPKDAAL